MSLTPDPNAVPHEGEEGRVAPLPPQRYEPEAPLRQEPSVTTGSEVSPAPESAPTTLDRLEAISKPLAVVIFLVCGFALRGWAWAWIVFLVPGILHAWNRPERRD